MWVAAIAVYITFGPPPKMELLPTPMSFILIGLTVTSGKYSDQIIAWRRKFLTNQSLYEDRTARCIQLIRALLESLLHAFIRYFLWITNFNFSLRHRLASMQVYGLSYDCIHNVLTPAIKSPCSTSHSHNMAISFSLNWNSSPCNILI